jgi:hypothetical protein
VIEDWPSPKHSDDERQPLPRVEDLPRGDGYDAEAVEDAFDAFYRHLAQLDSTLRTLEAVDAFSRQAAELRADLRSIRVAGWSHIRAATPSPHRSRSARASRSRFRGSRSRSSS